MIILANPKIILANMQAMLDEYKKATILIRGIEPYISIHCIDKYTKNLRIINGIKDVYSPYNGCDVLVMVKYPRGLPNYQVADNYSKESLHKALWWADLDAWQEHESFKASPREVNQRKLLHESYMIKAHIKLKELGIIPFFEEKDDELVEFLTKIDNKIGKSHKDIKYTKTEMDIIGGNDIFHDSIGTSIIQEHSRMTTEMTAYTKADDMPERTLEMHDRIGGFGGFELLKKLKKEALQKADDLGKKVAEFAKAKSKDGNFRLTKSTYDCVLDGKVAAVSIHEVGAGHAAEATLSEYDSIAAPFGGKLGEKVGIEDLNIIDYGLLEIQGVKPFSWYTYDTEGVKARKTWIVKDGKFNSFLHTKLTAGTIPKKEGGGVLTGNARYELEEGNEEPESRMSTLYLTPSRKKCSLEDLLHEIRGRGLYLAGLSFGETDRSQGKVGFQELYFINSAGNKVPIRMKGHEMYITENVVSYMSKIAKIGDKSTIAIDTGWCGSESGTIPHTASGAAIIVKGLDITPQKLEPPLKAPLIPIPKRKKAK